VAESEYRVGFGNYVLYRMCEEQPGHTNADVVEGKIWLIGRAYAAAIERGADNAGPKLYGLIAAEIAKANEVDGWLASVSDIKQVDANNVGRVLAVHRKFVDLLKKLAGGKRATRRSFASKYLHFHNPKAFFIFDSQANAEIRRRCKELTRAKNVKSSQLGLSPDSYDEAYADFVLCCIQYRDEEARRRGNGPMSPRQLDQELLGYGLPTERGG
jgi:hypothetical protein